MAALSQGGSVLCASKVEVNAVAGGVVASAQLSLRRTNVLKPQLGHLGLGLQSASKQSLHRVSIVRGSAAMEKTVDLNARRPEVESSILGALDNCITESYLNDSVPGLGAKIRGKVSCH